MILSFVMKQLIAQSLGRSSEFAVGRVFNLQLLALSSSCLDITHINSSGLVGFWLKWLSARCTDQQSGTKFAFRRRIIFSLRATILKMLSQREAKIRSRGTIMNRRMINVCVESVNFVEEEYPKKSKQGCMPHRTWFIRPVRHLNTTYSFPIREITIENILNILNMLFHGHCEKKRPSIKTETTTVTLSTNSEWGESAACLQMEIIVKMMRLSYAASCW